MWEIMVASFAAGFLTKVSDMAADDGLDLGRRLSYVTGLSYGFILAWIISGYPLIAPLALAVVLGVVFTGKIDHTVHYLGIGSMVLFLSIFGLQPVSIALLAVFLAAGAVDEIGNDLTDKGKLGRVTSTFFTYRLFLEITAFAVSVYTGSWIFFAAMFSADMGYTFIFRIKDKAEKLFVRRRPWKSRS
jgi:hypothetical protein